MSLAASISSAVAGAGFFRARSQNCEAGAALVGGILPPEQLASHLMAQAGHVRLDEGAVDRQDAEGVVGHDVEPGHQPPVGHSGDMGR